MSTSLFKKYGVKISTEDSDIQQDDVHYDPVMNKFFSAGDPAAAEQTPETEILSIDPTPVTALFDQMEVVSTEAAITGNLVNYFSRKADKINMSIREGFKYITTMNYQPMEQLHPMQLESFLSTLVFDEHESLKVSQPAGFKGELAPYTTGLLARARVMAQVMNDVIRPAASRFGHYLSIPMDRAERRDFEGGIVTDLSIDQLIKDDAQFFAQNRSATASLGSLFGSFREVVEAENNMLAVQAILDGGAASNEVKRAVDSLSVVATALITRLGEDTKNKPSREFSVMIADQLTEVAKWVEWYAMQMTRIIETNNVLYSIEKELRKL
ncbi:virion structural protein [Pseudomonas phage Phabio]|uniref:Virion structural protein n=1 Tax=Pseudomonas phage Phabio TaxID=2006668 RepID=A0A1Y0T1Y7_9CAUD|nr:virion structural protein [Pseudomonas phage Phabio]ARV76857.1 virion structural protein [Pseudomonas phage Phabio]